MATNTRAFLDDKESLEALIEKMPSPDREVYKSYGALTLESAFPGRKMVIYTLKGGIPTDIVVISFGELKVDWELGPSAEISDSRGKMELLTIPKQYRPRDLFLHIPQSFQLKYTGKRSPSSGVASVSFISQFAVLMKTKSREHLQVDGHTYCCALNRFRERFADLNLKY